MSIKSDLSNANTSNGFKKRLLRPVSTNKQSQSNNHLTNSRILHLKHSLYIHNQYTEVHNLMNILQKQVENLCPLKQLQTPKQLFTNLSSSTVHIKVKGLDCIKNRINSIKLKKQSIVKINQSSIKDKLSNENKLNIIQTQKSIGKILQQLQTQNLQEGLKILYKQKQQFNKVIQNSFYLISLPILNQMPSQNLSQQSNLFEKINGDQNKVELFLKILQILIKTNISFNNLSNIKKQNQIQEDFQQFIPKPKFKTIFSAKDDTAQNQEIISQMKLQIGQLKNKNSELSKLLQKYQNQSKHQNEINLNKKIQAIHKQMKYIYQQALKIKNQDIQRLKHQLIQTQQIYLKQSSFYQFNVDSDKKSPKPKDLNMLISSNISSYSQNKEYASTVQEQFQKMRSGFIKKLQKLQNQFIEKQLKLKKQLFAMEKIQQSLERQNRLILKKYQFLLSQGQ